MDHKSIDVLLYSVTNIQFKRMVIPERDVTIHVRGNRVIFDAKNVIG